MKKMLIISSGFLPIPAVDGGAVESLTENYLKYNDIKDGIEFVTYSFEPTSIKKEEIQNLKNTEFRFVKRNRVMQFVFKAISKLSRHRFPDYFIYSIKKDLKKRKEHYNVLIIENMPRYILFFNKKIADKFILHQHNDWLNKDEEYAKEILNKYDKIIVVSEYSKKQVLTIAKSEKIKVILNGIETERFKKIEDTKKILQIKKKYLLDDKDFIFIFTGKLKEEKGAFEIVKAFSKVTKQYKNAKLLMIGSSFNINAKTTPYIQSIYNYVKNNQQIIFTGFVDYRNVHELYAIADAQVVPSIIDDPCPLVVLEGLSSGLPLIVTRSGGIPEEVDESCAFIINRDDDLVDNLANNMKILIQDKALATKMGKAAKKRSEYFKNERFCEDILKEFENI